MHNCDSLDPLVTPYVDGELADEQRSAVEDHLRRCPPCHSRIAAERAVHDLLRAQKPSLCRLEAPDALHLRCAGMAELRNENLELRAENPEPGTANGEPGTTNGERRTPDGEQRTANEQPRIDTLRSIAPIRAPRGATRLVPYALAASLVVTVGGAFVYQATDKSARVLAAELVADHAKCFALNSALGTHEGAAAVEQSMAAAFDWPVHLSDDASRSGLELVGARQCLYGEGRIAHIMYRHQGRPVSLFMLPRSARAQELVEVLGHEAAIWCANNRTFVLVAREPRQDVERIASYVQAALH